MADQGVVACQRIFCSIYFVLNRIAYVLQSLQLAYPSVPFFFIFVMIYNVLSLVQIVKFLHDIFTTHPVAHHRGQGMGWLLWGGQAWWRHQMETFSALLVLCAGISPVTGDFPAQRPVTRSFGVFFDLRLNKRLYKQSWGWWFETQWRSF